MPVDKELEEFVKKANRDKIILTPGPASLSVDSICELRSGFGRNDDDLTSTKIFVEENLKKMTFKENVVSLQGSATLAIEIGLNNFVQGRVLHIQSGYYSSRMLEMLRCSEFVKSIEVADYDQLDDVGTASFDWVVFCHVETAIARKMDVQKIKRLADELGAKVFMDSTASIGLEDGQEWCDVCAFSSCKGLLSLTGASFVAFNDLDRNKVSSFYMSIDTHENAKVTGPYHQLYSISGTLRNYVKLRKIVQNSKAHFLQRHSDKLLYPPAEQPFISTRIKGNVMVKVNSKSSVVLYTPRQKIEGTSVICHLGDVGGTLNSTTPYSHDFIGVV